MRSERGLTIGRYGEWGLAAGLYGLWAYVLFAPYASGLSSSFKLLYALNPALGAMGVFLLSRRWIAGWMPSALAGLFYGFGPFGLSFLGFHPVNGLTFAAVPWLLLPAAYWQRGRQPTVFRFAVRALLCVLPFAFIIVFFWAFSQYWVGQMLFLPRQYVLSHYDFMGFVLPQSMTARPVVLGLYHTGLPAALMGLFVYLSVQRITVLIPPLAGLILGFLSPVFRVSPIIWASLPMVFLAILAGLGIQALLWAGKSDGKWVFICMIVGLVAGGICLGLYLPDRPDVYMNPAMFYPAIGAGLGIILLMSRFSLRVLPIRWLLLAVIAGADCFLGAQWFIGRLM